MKYLPLIGKSCENCMYFDEEEVFEVMIVYPATDCLFLYDAKGLTPKQRRKIRKALTRYNKGEHQPYCKFWVSRLILTRSHKDIKKKGTEFLEGRLGE